MREFSAPNERKSPLYFNDKTDIYIKIFGEDEYSKSGALVDDFNNNCNYCDQPLRLDKNNRCICCGAQK